MTARRPADIANDLRRVDSFGWVNTREAIATEVEALPMLTADEVADLRAVALRWRRLGPEVMSDHDQADGMALIADAANLAKILDRIDPPTVEVADYLDGNPGVDYCVVHHGLRNEDAAACDMAGHSLSMSACVLVPLSYDPAAARAALAAERGAS